MAEPGWREALEPCEREALHLSGAIQPHGALLHIGRDGRVTHASANAPPLLGRSLGEILGAPLEDLLPGCDPRSRFTSEDPGQKVILPWEARLEGGAHHLALSAGPAGWLAEIFPEAPAPPRAAGPPAAPPARPQGLQDVARECEAVAQAVRALSGFERVMVYRFAEDWTGETITQVGGQEFGDYLGLRFPASDIPQIARDLYLRNRYRLIPDVGYQPVPILGLDPDALVDLTWSDLRSVSPVHVQYLKNMGVGSSFSLSIKVSGQLWGLIACHHRTPHAPSLDAQQRCAERVEAFALRLSMVLTTERMRFLDEVSARLADLVGRIAAEPDLAAGLRQAERELLDLVGATGAACLAGEQCVRLGQAPPEPAIRELADWALRGDKPVFFAERLPDEPAARGLREIASGLLAVQVSPPAGRRRLCFLWFRPELQQTVLWAGRPEKTLGRIEGREVLTPRTSFSLWQETTSGQSRPWSRQDVLTAQKFRSYALQQLLPRV